MPKGKKKDKKKDEDVPSLAPLTLTEPQSSTSQSSTTVTEEDVGLGLGVGRKRSKPKKKQSEPHSASSPSEVQQGGGDAKEAEKDTTKVEQSEVASSSQKVVKLEQSSTSKKEEDEDADGLGLGLGGSKKNRRKKKKTDQPAPDTSKKPDQPEPNVSQSHAAPPVPTPTPVQAPAQAPASVPGPWATRAQTGSVQQPPQPAVSVQPMFPQPPPQVPTRVPEQPSGSGLQASRQKTVVAPRNLPVTQSPPVCLFKIPDKVTVKMGRPVPSRPIKVIANYLEMQIKALKIYRYDIDFKPEKPKKFVPLAYKAFHNNYFRTSTIAFDQSKNLYSLNSLPGVREDERFKYMVNFNDNNGKQVEIEVSVKFTGLVDFSSIISHMQNGGSSLNPPTEAIQAVDVILRQGTLESYVKVGRQFFKRPNRPIDLGGGLEMWTGLFQSAIFTSRPYINIDVAHKGFPKNQMLIDAFINDFGLDPSLPIENQQPRKAEAFLLFLKNLRVTAFIGGDTVKGQKRDFICNGVVKPPRDLKFIVNEGTKDEAVISVADYFEKDKKLRFRYPKVNCVWVGPKEKKIYYPMECLMVSYGQVMNKQLNDFQLATLVKESATPPPDRKAKIQEVIKDMNYSRNEYFRKFGLDIANEFLNVDAKILQAPNIEIGGASVEPRRGVWQSKRFLKPQALDSWAFIAVDTDTRNNYTPVIDMIVKAGTDAGMRIRPPKLTLFNVREHELMKTLQTARDEGIIIMFVVLSARSKDCYHKLKRAAEREVGVLTQCIREFTCTRKMNFQTAHNIMLKVNSKLMGINHALDNRSVPVCLQSGKIMLVGADVTHPSPDMSSVPSIAAVTASMDSKFSIYNITLSIQTPKKEMIVDFENMMLEHFVEFEKLQRELPSKIYVFRDGVSEGQFAQVMNSELQAIHKAYARKAGSRRRPEVLFILVQKRHHTRFFLANSSMNVEPGTVVDTKIVHPRELDFYLVSHQAIKGTARPTRYHAVCNDGAISQDEVEQLAYYLCHLYSRCSRAVSYPTPTYYAHLACMRARSLTYGENFIFVDINKSPQRLSIKDINKMFFV
ncbi:protein argonaute-2-like isoform X2 [Epargyreus clarus]|uniref:protein argonaute-2-like isoform X2 n=1 Tax=Epargyreus clarus TaxID=520877 RepID=UPI003C2DB517